MTLFGLGEHFTGLYGADLAGRLDDKVELLAHLAAREGLDPARAIMIGDRQHDLRAARMNGAGAIGVLWGYGTREELAGADGWATRPAELGAAVEAVRASRGRAR